MPAAKQTTRTATNKTARPTSKKAGERTTERSGERTLSVAHKKALAEGRTMSAIVDRYLAAINTPKKRGRKISKATLTQRLALAQARVKTATGVDKVLAAQEVRDLQARLARASARGVDMEQLEAAFVKVAGRFSESRGISYASWRDAGVPAAVLKRAGVVRTRG